MNQSFDSKILNQSFDSKRCLIERYGLIEETPIFISHSINVMSVVVCAASTVFRWLNQSSLFVKVVLTRVELFALMAIYGGGGRPNWTNIQKRLIMGRLHLTNQIAEMAFSIENCTFHLKLKCHNIHILNNLPIFPWSIFFPGNTKKGLFVYDELLNGCTAYITKHSVFE